MISQKTNWMGKDYFTIEFIVEGNLLAFEDLEVLLAINSRENQKIFQFQVSIVVEVIIVGVSFKDTIEFIVFIIEGFNPYQLMEGKFYL